VSRPNFPQRSVYFPPTVQLDLLPFGEAALTHFLYLERPQGMERMDAEGFVPTAPPQDPLAPDEALPRVQDFATAGHLLPRHRRPASEDFVPVTGPVTPPGVPRLPQRDPGSDISIRRPPARRCEPTAKSP